MVVNLSMKYSIVHFQMQRKAIFVHCNVNKEKHNCQAKVKVIIGDRYSTDFGRNYGQMCYG